MRRPLRFGLVLLLVACGHGAPASSRIAIAHLNDTHSHLESVPVNLTLDGQKTTAQVGGFARLQTAVDELRRSQPQLLLLHAGDAVQGTLYFNLFNGSVDFEFLNRLGVDAMTFGNHEFDRGPAAIPTFVRAAHYPFVSTNIDFSGEPAIAPLVSRFVVRHVGEERIGILGLTTETTPLTTLDVGKAKFDDPKVSAASAIQELASQGVNKIVVLSHLGYPEDVALAKAVAGIDVIVGGHTHTLLGDPAALSPLGLSPEGPYPTEVIGPDGRPVLVLQAWQWGDVLGMVSISFSSDGVVTSYSANPTLVVGESFQRGGQPVAAGSESYQRIIQALAASGTARIVAQDPAVAAALEPYSRQVSAYRGQRVATAAEDLVRGLNRGPGPLVADSMLGAVPSAQLAILNWGGLRKDLLAGPLSVGDVLELLPFGNTLYVVDLTGAELRSALEDGVQFLLGKFPGQSPPPLPYVAGFSYGARPTAPKGKRIVSLSIKTSGGVDQPIRPEDVYRVVVNNFVAGGGDGFTAIKNAAGFRSDTGIIDADAFTAELKRRVSVSNLSEKRVVVLPPETAAAERRCRGDEMAMTQSPEPSSVAIHCMYYVTGFGPSNPQALPAPE